MLVLMKMRQPMMPMNPTRIDKLAVFDDGYDDSNVFFAVLTPSSTNCFTLFTVDPSHRLYPLHHTIR
jgi:hypothetical protein